MIEGNCLCGGVRFRIDPSEILLFNNCYCKRCQRESGAGFVSQLQVPVEHFQWLEGKELIQRYESSPGLHRAFCRICGSRVPITNDRDIVPVHAGGLNDNPGVLPEVNIHLQSKAEWAIHDSGIACVADQGSTEFWTELMHRKKNPPEYS